MITPKEARDIALIMLTADSFCSCCNTSLLEQFIKYLPEHVDIIKKVLDDVKIYEEKYRKLHDKWDFDLSKPEPNIWEIE